MTFCHDSQRMLTAGCTCLYIPGIGSVCIRSHPGGLKFTFLCSLQQCRAGSGFVFALLILSLFRIWVSHTTCSSEYVWVLGGDCPCPKTPWVMPGKMSSFIKCLKHVAKWGLYTRILYPTKVCLSLKMSPDYQTCDLGVGYCLQFLINAPISFRSQWSTCSLLQKTSDLMGHPANISVLLREDLALAASTVSARLSQRRRICHQHNQKHGEGEKWD